MLHTIQINKIFWTHDMLICIYKIIIKMIQKKRKYMNMIMNDYYIDFLVIFSEIL